MTTWLPCPHAGDYAFLDADEVRAQWPRLHALDAEPLPRGEAALAAWALLHAGQFERAEAAGLAAGVEGLSVANRAATAHATLVEPGEKARLALLQRVHLRGRQHAALAPLHPNAWFWQGYALARYAQGIHVARALAQGLGTQVRAALEMTLMLAPGHALAHAALGLFHAEVIDKVGPLVGAMTYGARAETALHHLREAGRLAPDSAAVMIARANAVVMLEGEARLAEAARLQEQAAAVTARDAVERLWVELARANLAL